MNYTSPQAGGRLRGLFGRALPLLWPFLLMGLLAPALQAQQKASAEFHHRVTDLGVELRIDIEVDPTWHLYHTSLGAPDAIGTVTTVEIDTIGAEFGEVRFPTPHRTPMEIGTKGRPTWAWTHGGKLTLWSFGVWDDEPDPDLDVWVTINGQTCSDMSGMCVQYEEELDSLGAGDEALFADFPDDLRVVPEVLVEEEDAIEDPVFEAGGFSAGSYGDQPEPEGFGDAYARGELFHRIDGDQLTVVARIELAPDWHLYGPELGHPEAVGLPTKITFEADGVEFGDPVFPEAHKSPQEDFGTDVWIYTYDHEVVITAVGTIPGTVPTEVTARIDGQTCSDVTGSCVLYGEDLTSAGSGADELFAEAAESIESVDNEPAGATLVAPTVSELSLWDFILLCIGGGLFTLLMPCTYPMIPITISFFTKQAEATGKPTLGLPLAYGLGIIMVFEIIGLVFAPFIIPFATHWLTNAIIGLAFIYFAFVLLGMITLQPPRFLLNAAGTASQRGGLIGVFLMGTTLVVTSFTCTAPIVGSILAVGATDGSTGRLMIGMGVFGLTMAIPFVVLSLVPGKLKAMPSSGEWMNTLKVTLGFVELAAAFKFLSNWDLAKDTGLIPDEVLLLLWISILGVAAAYLLGFVKLTSSNADRISPGRALAGTGFLVLVGYLTMILLGYPRSEVMHAFLPGFSNGSIALSSGSDKSEREEHGHTVFENEFDTAMAQAAFDKKLLLINLTGRQ
ncbi:MAG: protein-disulfide reductase DsbD family protein [Planctomycetota bacterium]|nr:protein-disulfide reductase DsbD family protein [Planctomycetota bacterium]